MSGIEIGVASVVAILGLIWAGVHVAVALGLVSLVGVWALRGNLDVALNLLSIAARDSIANYVFGVIPLFVMMGLVINASNVGRDAYLVAQQAFRRVRGGLGIATVAANALFAAMTGISIASAAVFTRISVPEMLRFGYSPRFAVGVVAGSSVLGMLIPPSILMVVYALLVQESVADMFIAGLVPGLLLAVTYGVAIAIGVRVWPGWVMANPQAAALPAQDDTPLMGWAEIAAKLLPAMGLIALVLGGIYGGLFTPTEAGAAGTAGALILAAVQRRMTWAKLWDVVMETGQITASILFLVISATMYSRMLGVAGMPTEVGRWVDQLAVGFVALMVIYILILLILGMIMDAVSIILITVPLFLPAFQGFGVDLVWFGVITVIAVEIGLLTPPLGLSCYVIKSSLSDPRVTLWDVFAGAAPFALIMLIVLGLVVAFPALSLMLI